MTQTYRIGVIGGDGIGPEVVREALQTLELVAQAGDFRYELIKYPWSSQHYLDTGELMPERMLDEYRTLDAVLLGALGDPRLEPGLIERNIIMGLRFGLDLYINLRPVQCFADHLSPLKDKGAAEIDFIVIRENTEDFYTGIGGFFKKGTPDEVALVEGIYTRKGCERALRYGLELAQTRAKMRAPGANRRPKVTLVDKANAIRAHDLWQRAFVEAGAEYPDVERDHAYVDAACMWMVKNPEWFDVIVTPNLFGDIITDLGAVLQGGLGVAASGNIHPGRTSMFEPIHGSAPKYAGQDVACPLGAIMALAMLLTHVGQAGAATLIEQAVRELLVSRRIPSTQAGVMRTSEMGALVRGEIERIASS
ncbi:MAG TPA: 3-isopropylmalate dehydrogenase [Roseiflexaceae bacterium]|nr:3-isopropylmalate dehydrogenase [Roseiflexaceae bacterium]